MRFRPTLAQTFFAANLCLAALLGALLLGLLRGSEESVLATSERLRRATSVLIVERIQAYFEGAERLVDSLERQIQVGLCDPEDPLSVEKALFAAALDHPGLAGASFTAGRPLGWRTDGGLLLAPTGRWQVSVYREGTEGGGALHELARILGRYLEVMAKALQSSGGTIDKYIGDAIMAVWNAPTPCADHPRRACEAALAAVAAGEALYASREWAGHPPLVTRFGLHTGGVLVGHFGAPDRLSYTCLGDGVNLAARLEGLNKEYGTTILVSDAVRQAAGSAFSFRSLDVVAVSGKGQAVPVHELMGPAEVSALRREAARAYEAAFAHYLRRDFRTALVQFEALEADRPSVVMADRCRRLLASPPPQGWDGTYVATSK